MNRPPPLLGVMALVGAGGCCSGKLPGSTDSVSVPWLLWPWPLDVPVTLLRRRLPLNRPAAPSPVLDGAGPDRLEGVRNCLLPELVQQAKDEFTQLVPCVCLHALGEAGRASSVACRNLEQACCCSDAGPLGAASSPWAPSCSASPASTAEHDGPDGADGSCLATAAGASIPRSQSAVVCERPLAATASAADLPTACCMTAARVGGWLGGMTISGPGVVRPHLGRVLALLQSARWRLLSGLVCAACLTFVPTIGPQAATLLPAGGGPADFTGQAGWQVLILRLLLHEIRRFRAHPLLTCAHRQPAANGGPDGPAQSSEPCSACRRLLALPLDRWVAWHGDLPAGAGGGSEWSRMEPARR